MNTNEQFNENISHESVLSWMSRRCNGKRMNGSRHSFFARKLVKYRTSSKASCDFFGADG